jgi:hypothetical protein
MDLNENPLLLVQPNHQVQYAHASCSLFLEHLRKFGDLNILHSVQNDDYMLECGYAFGSPPGTRDSINAIIVTSITTASLQDE